RLYLADGFAGTPLLTKPVRAIAEVRFQDGFHHQLDRGLYDAVANRRNPESTTLSRFPRLRDVHPSDRHRAVSFRAKLSFELVEDPVDALRLNLRDRLFVDPGAATVPADPLPRLPQHISSVDLVIQNSERPARRCLGRAVPLPLKYPHLFMRRGLSRNGSPAVRPPRASVTEVGALCSRGITLLRCSYDPLRLPAQASVGTSASGLISFVSTASIGGPGGVSSLTPVLCPCMLPPSPREPRWVRIPNSSAIDSSLRPMTGGSATPVPALAAITAGYTLTGA